MNNARPIHLDLRQISLPLPGLVSIMHRVSGAVLFLALPLLLWWLQQSLTSVNTFTSVQAYRFLADTRDEATNERLDNLEDPHPPVPLPFDHELCRRLPEGSQPNAGNRQDQEVAGQAHGVTPIWRGRRQRRGVCEMIGLRRIKDCGSLAWPIFSVKKSKIVAPKPANNESFNLSHSGQDL